MTELIVALDGRNPKKLARELIVAGVSWFKLGSQSFMTPRDYADTFEFITGHFGCDLMIDLKSVETRDTIWETVKRAVDAGVSAISTFTNDATELAMAAAGLNLQVWQVLKLTDGSPVWEQGMDTLIDFPDGFICPLSVAKQWKISGAPVKLICPGIRLTSTDHFNNHVEVATAREAAEIGIDYAVVGRPIDSVAAAKAYIEALSGNA